MVEDWNSKKRDHNREVEHRNNFKVGDRVKMQLKRENKLLKSRVEKWSSGDYTIIGREGNTYTITPAEFDEEVYQEKYLEEHYHPNKSIVL